MNYNYCHTDVTQVDEQFDIDELHKNEDDRLERKAKIYYRILNRIYSRIKMVSKASETFCFFIVPEFIFGVPLYNNLDCIKFILNKLIHKGFLVKYTHPNLLYISWDRKYVNPNYNRIKKMKQLKEQEQEKEHKKNMFRTITDYNPSGSFVYDSNSLNALRNQTDSIQQKPKPPEKKFEYNFGF
jgi:hypothetical protein